MYLQFSTAMALVATGLPPLAVTTPQGSVSECPSQPSEDKKKTQELLADASEVTAGSSEARSLLSKAVMAPGQTSARLEALRQLIRSQEVADLPNSEALLGCIGSDERTLARSWIALRRGDFAGAEKILKGAVLPRHHMLPRWSAAHDLLGDAYSLQGQIAPAQGQWLIALATASDPGGTGFSPEQTRNKLVTSYRQFGMQPYLPLNRYHDAVSILDIGSVRRTSEGVAYSKLVLLKSTERGADFGIDSYETDCDNLRSRVVRVQSFSADGSLVRESGDTPWVDDRPGEPFLGTERKLVCALDAPSRIARSSRSHADMLKTYRAGERFVN